MRKPLPPLPELEWEDQVCGNIHDSILGDKMNTNDVMQSRRPSHMPDYAEDRLQALASDGLGEHISLGVKRK